MIALAAPAAAQPVLDPTTLPNPTPAARVSYDAFLLMNLPRAYAIGTNGIAAAYGGGGRIEAARDNALKLCGERGGTGCALYAENLEIIWPGRPRPALPVPPAAPFISGPGYEFIADSRFFWWGPAKAKGVYVFAHGKNANGVDARGSQPQPHLRAFNNRGFDVIRFDREVSADDKDRAAQWLREGLPRIRALGYRFVVAGGQSRGGWNSLQILDTPGLADAVIAISAATNGINAGQQASLGQAELYRMFSAARAPTTRVAIVQFRDDDFEHNPDRRIEMARDLIQPHVAALLTINQPEGISGHGGGATIEFARGYAACLYEFATAARTAC
jgi:hypothetical protein